MSILKKLNPKKNEVIRIKFKPLNQIVEESPLSYSDTEEHYNFGSNIKAYLKGGDFIVEEDYEHDEEEKPIDRGVCVKNHFDCSHEFWIHETAIAEAEMVQDSERFSSHDHGILVVRVDDEMYINGQPLIWNEINDKAYHDRNKRHDSEPYENKNRRLLKMFENYIADLAVRESFKDMGEE